MVLATDGVELAVQEHGSPSSPTVLLVHGYPDDHTVWDGVVAVLAARFRVVTYDVRGAGGSGKPRGINPYLLSQLEADLASVIDAVSPDRPVHLVGHDWGSLQSWHAVTGNRLAGRLASYTSFCGTDLDHAGDWFRRCLRQPTPRSLSRALRQFLHSQYITFFLIPGVPKLLLSSRAARRLFAYLAANEGIRTEGWPSTSDLVHGLSLYRANIPGTLRSPRPTRASCPVQVVSATGDRFVTEALQRDVARWVDQLWVRRLEGGHWVPRSHPEAVAACITDLVSHVETSR